MEALHPKHAWKLGMSRSALYRASESGKYERIARGIYRATDAPPADFDWIEAATRRPESTICLISALAHYDLTDEIPAALDIAIPRGTRAPATPSAIAWHHFAAKTFDLGRIETVIPGSELTIGIYSPARTIADAFRLRGELGYEIGRDALREWLSRGGKPAEIMAIASKLPRAKTPILHALEALA
jgi:predicted transcriptional regulator of viral defense system